LPFGNNKVDEISNGVSDLLKRSQFQDEDFNDEEFEGEEPCFQPSANFLKRLERVTGGFNNNEGSANSPKQTPS
jgi:hypothetical protein